MKICAHIHTHHSEDSNSKVGFIIKKAYELGYDVVAITDHNTVAGSIEAKHFVESSPDFKNEINIIIGAEYTTNLGHILGYFVDESIEKTCKKINGIFDFDDLVDKIKNIGGLSFLAHPILSKAPDDCKFIEKLDGYEVINGRVVSSFKSKESDRFIKELQESSAKAQICGADAHSLGEIESTFMIVNDIYEKPIEIYRSIDNKEHKIIKESVLKAAFLGDKEIRYYNFHYSKVAFNKLTQNKGKSLGFYIKQIIKIKIGFFIDLNNRLRNNKYESIRICTKVK